MERPLSLKKGKKREVRKGGIIKKKVCIDICEVLFSPYSSTTYWDGSQRSPCSFV
jgi:hypothetical protein